MGESSYIVLVTGGSGYIGSSISRELVDRGFRVKSVDLVEPKKRESGVEYFTGDLADTETLDLVGPVDVIIHTAIIQLPKINEDKIAGYRTNFIATRNVVEYALNSESVKGLILAGSWHIYGEKLRGVVDEAYGYHPDRVTERSRLYVFSKIAQEMFVRYADEMGDDKVFAIIRLGTVLGEGMPEKTAANIFIERAVSGKPITPFRDSMHRPMLYVDVRDVAKAFSNLTEDIIFDKLKGSSRSLDHIYNLFYPRPITIYELATLVRDLVRELSQERVTPKVEIVDRGLELEFDENAKNSFEVSVSESVARLRIGQLNPPDKVLRRLISAKLEEIGSRM